MLTVNAAYIQKLNAIAAGKIAQGNMSAEEACRYAAKSAKLIFVTQDKSCTIYRAGNRYVNLWNVGNTSQELVDGGVGFDDQIWTWADAE